MSYELPPIKSDTIQILGPPLPYVLPICLKMLSPVRCVLFSFLKLLCTSTLSSTTLLVTISLQLISFIHLNIRIFKLSTNLSSALLIVLVSEPHIISLREAKLSISILYKRCVSSSKQEQLHPIFVWFGV